MTDIYFVRHCQSQDNWDKGDDIKPLTQQGIADSAAVTEALRAVKLDLCVCSTYMRSMDTIRGCAENHGLIIHTDPRLGERVSGPSSDEAALIKRWENHDYHEDGGECLNDVQRRNISALKEVLTAHNGESILWGTHGTALSVIINYFEPDFGYDDFIRLFDWMPYIVHAVFDGEKMVRREDVFHIPRGY